MKTTLTTITTTLAAASLFVGSTVAAQTTIVSYDSGVTAAAGQTEAADPSIQGWVFDNGAGGNAFAAGYDSGDGGWRTVDGTGTLPANYSQSLSSSDQAALNAALGWTVSWTVSLDKDAIPSSGSTVNNYYVAPNNGRQNNIITLIDFAGASSAASFSITHTVDASNNLLLRDDNTSTTYNTGIDISAFPSFATFSLTYDTVAGTAVLDYGAGTASIAGSNPLIGGRNAVFFGAGTSAGQGSAVWNEVSLATVPEPSSFALLAGLCGMFYLGLRRR